MKKALVFISLLAPLIVISQNNLGRILIFRNTGISKSMVACQLQINKSQSHRLSNKHLLVIETRDSSSHIEISLDRHQRRYNFKTPLQDTLFLEVQLNSSRGGVLPSSRVRPALRVVGRKRAHQMMKEKWALKTLAK